MLEHVNNRGEVTLVTQEAGDSEEDRGQTEEEAERGHGEAGVTDALGPLTVITLLIAGTPRGSHSHTRGDIRTWGQTPHTIHLCCYLIVFDKSSGIALR